MNPTRLHLRLSGPKAVICFFLLALVMLVICGIIGSLLLAGGPTSAKLRIFATLQDLLVFILPAVATAMLITDRPADLLGLTISPGLAASLAAILALLFATPALNALVSWNESFTLPESLAVLEQAMRSAEEAAQESVEMLMGGTAVSDLIMGILIVGVLAGFSEEIFFRGGLMRILTSSGMNGHVAIWLTAVIFSTFHFQFYGFFPRIVLGALFGYLLRWSRSVWLPAIVHAFNNSVIVVAAWLTRCGYLTVDINKTGSDSLTLVIGSVILTLGLLRAMRRHLFAENETVRRSDAGRSVE